MDLDARFDAMCSQWDRSIGAFRCYYTGLALTGPPGSRRYATWEHVTPGESSRVALVADIVNKMKNDMDEEEFKTIVRALARHFDGAPFEELSFPSERRL